MQLEREVAIKFIRPRALSDELTAERFEREAKAAARLGSEHVVQIIDYGLDDELAFLVMELLAGEDLEARFRRHGQMRVERAIDLARQMGEGLRCVHEGGVVHRDIKPANVFLAQLSGREVVKLLDFGIAKVESASSSSTETGIVMGSPRYMSPEQARSTRRADHRSDLWSFAVILFRAVTGHELFQGETVADIVIKVCTEPIPTPTSVSPELPKGLDRFFRKALQRDADRRYQSAPELVHAFEQALGASEPIVIADEESTWSDDPRPSSDDAPSASNTLTATNKTLGATRRTRSILWLVAAAMGASAIALALTKPWSSPIPDAPNGSSAAARQPSAPSSENQSAPESPSPVETQEALPEPPPAGSAPTPSASAPSVPIRRPAPRPTPPETPASAPPKPAPPPPDAPEPPEKMNWGI